MPMMDGAVWLIQNTGQENPKIVLEVRVIRWRARTKKNEPEHMHDQLCLEGWCPELKEVLPGVRPKRHT